MFFDAPQQNTAPQGTVKPKSLLNQVILDQEKLETKRSQSIMSDLLNSGRSVTPMQNHFNNQNENGPSEGREQRERDSIIHSPVATYDLEGDPLEPKDMSMQLPPLRFGEHSAFERVNSRHEQLESLSNSDPNSTEK